MHTFNCFVAAACLCGLAACGKGDAPPSAAVAPAASSTAPATAPPPAPAASVAPSPVWAWAGRWTGPEGTYLEIAGTGAALQVTIRNLDGPRSFPAQMTDGALAFERDGLKETIRPGTGPQTGMKWLQDKTDCLVVKLGEGYCR